MYLNGPAMIFDMISRLPHLYNQVLQDLTFYHRRRPSQQLQQQQEGVRK